MEYIYRINLVLVGSAPYRSYSWPVPRAQKSWPCWMEEKKSGVNYLELAGPFLMAGDLDRCFQ